MKKRYKVYKYILRFFMTWPGAVLFTLFIPFFALFIALWVIGDCVKRFVKDVIDDLKWEFHDYKLLQYPWLVRQNAKRTYDKLVKKEGAE